MSNISGKETKPEILVRKFLFSKGFRFRKNDSRYPGKPDIVLHKYKTVVFIHGCFWHGHKGCKYSKLPETNVYFWKNKVSSNIERDKKNRIELEKQGWVVLTIWQCELRNEKLKIQTLNKLIDILSKQIGTPGTFSKKLNNLQCATQIKNKFAGYASPD